MRFRRGFTLIELLVVIAVIGLLSSVVLATLSTARAKARDVQRMAFLHEFRTAIEMYASGHGVYPGVDGYYYTYVSGRTGWYIRGPNPPVDQEGVDAMNQFLSDLSPYISKLQTFPPVTKAIYMTTDGTCKTATIPNSWMQYHATGGGTGYKMATFLEMNCDAVASDGGTFAGGHDLGADSKGRSWESFELFSSGNEGEEPSY